jgi:hypothetical protein
VFVTTVKGGATPHLSLGGKLCDAVVSELRSQPVALTGDMHGRNQAVRFPAAKPGL